MQTRITELLGIRHAIIQGGGGRAVGAQLAAAVSNAGALGLLTAMSQPTPAALLSEIRRCRTLTALPFGVNLTMRGSNRPQACADYLDAIIESGVKIVETAGASPPEFVERMKRAGVRVLHQCGSLRDALSAERHGVDAISIDGFELDMSAPAQDAGRDPHLPRIRPDSSGLLLLPTAARALKIPVVASGGIVDGRGLAAVLALGAEGIDIGPRFLASREAPASERVAAYDDIRTLLRKVGGGGGHISRDPPGPDSAIQAAGRFGDESPSTREIPSCADLIERMLSECDQRLRQAAACMT